MVLPNFLIVGTQKSGTTSLQHQLARHPDVFIAPNEVHYFTRYFDRGPDWYAAQFAQGAGRRAVGEKTPTYSSIEASPDTPKRIRGLLPDAKLLWLFREPVARAHSHWWHAVRSGAEQLGFDEAIGRDAERVASAPARAYLTRSDYARQVRAYLEYFPRSAMHFVLFEDFVRDQARAAREVLAFLGLDPGALPADRVAFRVNTGLARDRGSLRAALRGLTRGRWFVLRARGRGFDYEPLDAGQWRALAARFAEKNRKLADLTGLDLAPWREPGGPDAA
jgi:hypothetical protein